MNPESMCVILSFPVEEALFDTVEVFSIRLNFGPES